MGKKVVDVKLDQLLQENPYRIQKSLLNNWELLNKRSASIAEAGKNTEDWSLGPAHAQLRKQSETLRHSSLSVVKI